MVKQKTLRPSTGTRDTSKPIVGQELTTEEEALNPDRLLVQLSKETTMLRNATIRKERCELLMRRKSAKKWDGAKKAKMVRRLLTASTEAEESELIIRSVSEKLEKLNSAQQNSPR